MQLEYLVRQTNDDPSDVENKKLMADKEKKKGS
jgi:hypothetical protein